ncbi:MAG: 4-hydroxy-3-methylbut-2-enyl diphosphate reductase [Bacteroidales bacterium]|nr:4-hydroxy-3-methylbut-2-enyl diphosphate reductase [Bacteroidales bacterium]MCF8405070.1 4-hydroxy-3-methylbut-2-enyl diphosphate reductase [Bacteroidales bacterium]
MTIDIDPHAGFCFGVNRAIDIADSILDKNEPLFSLGEIVHNQEEVNRLSAKGMTTIDYATFDKLKNKNVLIRAHGEPPSTYERAKENNIKLIEASCPIVLKLHEKIAKANNEMKEVGGKVVLLGKRNHPEVIGLIGHTNKEALVIESEKDLDHLDYTKPISIFAQTTISSEYFERTINLMRDKFIDAHTDPGLFKINNTICKHVSRRLPSLQDFCKMHQVIIFVSGKNSSNGNSLFKICLENNPRSYFISSVSDINPKWFNKDDRIGISGATSTPMWLMRDVENYLLTI